MADENGDVKQVKLSDSNMANYGSKEHIDARKKAAETEKEFKGAGKKVGLEIWRVENKRTAADTPDFGVKRWPIEEYGNFFKGDSYIVLNTYFAIDPVTNKKTDKLAWDVHFWLGSETSQDEKGVAAYKTVELDDLLDDGPVQHRETEGFESTLFLSYFKSIVYMEGGIASGFRTVKPEEYVPRLFRIRRMKKGGVKCIPVPVGISSLDQDDSFVLDAGLKVYLFIGSSSSAFEKSAANNTATSMVGGRNGKSKLCVDLDDDFWKILGGDASKIPKTSHYKEEDDSTPSSDADPTNCKLFRISDSSGSLEFTEVAGSSPKRSMLDSNDVFLLDGGFTVYVWIGKGASKAEKSQAMKIADQYLKNSGKNPGCPVTAIDEGKISVGFDSCFVKG